MWFSFPLFEQSITTIHMHPLNFLQQWKLFEKIKVGSTDENALQNEFQSIFSSSQDYAHPMINFKKMDQTIPY